MGQVKRQTKGLSLMETVLGSFLLFGIIVASFTFFSQVVRSGKTVELRDIANHVAESDLGKEKSKGLLSWDPVPTAIKESSVIDGVTYEHTVQRRLVSGFDAAELQELEVSVQWTVFDRKFGLVRKAWVSQSEF